MKIREAGLADAPVIARVHVDSWRTTYRGTVPDDILAGLPYQEREARWQRILGHLDSLTFVYVVEDESGQVVGFAHGGPERTGDPVYTGELRAIYLLDRHQRSGIGRQLVLAVADRLAQTGMQSMLVWVLADNHPARHFYEALGGRPVREQPIQFHGVTLQEIAYGWTDTGVMGRHGEG